MIACFFTLFFILEGIGLILPRQLNLHFYYLIPAVLFIYLLIRKKPILFPKITSIVYSLFLLFSLISTFGFSVDKQNSFELTLFYAAGFLIFIFFYNNKPLGQRLIKALIIFGSIVFSAFYLINLYLGRNPANGYQLISFYFNHNHLGDFLGLGLISAIYYLFNQGNQKWKYLAVFFPFFLIAFSRSAYLAFFITAALILFKAKSNRLYSWKTWLVLAGIVISLFFFFTTVQEAKDSKFFSTSYGFLSKTFALGNKNFNASRFIYLSQGWQSFREKPFFGVGPGNFGYISKKYQQTAGDWTETAHSFFPEILFENGFLAFGAFLLFVFIIFLQAVKKNQWESYLFLYLLLNFQFDYTYRIYLMFILFMIFAAVLYKDKEKTENNSTLYAIISAFLLVVFELILGSGIFLKINRPDLAFKIYPFNKEAFQPLIDKKYRQNCGQAIQYTNTYYYLFPQYLPAIEFLSTTYENCGDKRTALRFLKEAVKENKFLDFSVIERTYQLTKELEGKKAADRFFLPVFREYSSLSWLSPSFEVEMTGFCRDELILNCPWFTYFWQPKPNSPEHPNPKIPFSLVTNKMNADGLNDRFNYPVKKEKNTFRIVILGGSEAYGQYVPTKNNWTEKLEDLLNKNLICPPTKKIEVINLGVDGYDISYSVERFKLKGIKYQPDLILFFLPDPYLINDDLQVNFYQTPITQNDIKNKNYYPGWAEARQTTIDQLGENKIFKTQQTMLQELKNNYSGPIIFMKTDSFSDKEKKLINGVFKPEFFEANLQKDQGVFFPDGGNLNEKGHEIIANGLLNYFKKQYKGQFCLK